MTREELAHIIRASGEVTGQYEFMIVGSQSILGSVPNPAPVFTMSAEADIYPQQAPELAEQIEFTRPTATTRRASGQRRQRCPVAG